MTRTDLTMHSVSELSDIAVNDEYFYSLLEKGNLSVDDMGEFFIFTSEQAQEMNETIAEYK